MNRRLVLCTAASAVALTAAGCTASTNQSSGGNSSSGGVRTIHALIIGISSDASTRLGTQQGYYADEGLKLSTKTVPNPAAAIAAVQSGKVELAYTPSIPLLTALSHGVDLKVVAAADGYPPEEDQPKEAKKVDDTGLFVPKGSSVKRPRDLTGKKIAIPARKAQLEVNIAQVVKQDGGNPDKIQWVVLDFPSAVTALKKGRVDAAGLVNPFTTQATENGATLLSSPGLAFFKEGAVGLWVTSPKLAEDTALMNKLQKAIYKSNAYSTKHIPEAQKAAVDITKVSLKTIKAGATPYWPTTVQKADIQRANKNLADLGYLPKPVDLSNVILPQPKK